MKESCVDRGGGYSVPTEGIDGGEERLLIKILGGSILRDFRTGPSLIKNCSDGSSYIFMGEAALFAPDLSLSTETISFTRVKNWRKA
jgi:hypothetical protein